MRGLSISDLMPIEDECGQGSPLEVSSALLRRAAGSAMLDATIGERDALLLQLRAMTIGQEMELASDCPGCGLQLATQTTTDGLVAPPPWREGIDLDIGGRPMRVRAASAGDLAIAMASPQPREALACAVLEPLDGLPPACADDLSDAMLEAVSDALSELDPQSDILLDFHCPACKAQWTPAFDITAYFWDELRQHMAGLLDDIHDLARTYHWSEDTILALPARRRNAYLAKVRA